MTIYATAWRTLSMRLTTVTTPTRRCTRGPIGAARFLEIVIVVWADGTEVVIHAMKMRQAYAVLLPGGRYD